MIDTVLTRFSQTSLAETASLSRFQSQVDGMVSRFVEETTDVRTLSAMAMGSLFYRVGRIGTLALASRAASAAPLLNLASYGVGLASEVTAFQGVNDLFSQPTLHSSRETYFERWRTSFVQFGILKLTGGLASGENVLLQHTLQDASMVAGHQLTARLGWTSAPEGSLAEQFLHAEATNLQLGAGMSLLHVSAPGLAAFERGLDLFARARSIEIDASVPRNIFGSPAPQTAAGIAGEIGLRNRFYTVDSAESLRHRPSYMMTSHVTEGSPAGENLDRATPIRDDAQNKRFGERAQQLEGEAYNWHLRVDPTSYSSYREKLGGEPRPQESREEICRLTREHEMLVREMLAELRRPENGEHYDHDWVITQLEGIQRRIEQFRALQAEPSPSSFAKNKLLNVFTSFFRSANYLLELTRSRNYDPSLLSETLDQYHLILLHGFELFFPQHSTLLLRPSGSGREKGPDLLSLFQAPGLATEHFLEAYNDLASLRLRLENGRFLLDGTRRNERGEMVGRITRTFQFEGGAWNVTRVYEAEPTAEDLQNTSLAAWRPPLWDPVEAGERLRREIELYDRLNLERILPHDLPQNFWEIPFDTLPWFRERLRYFVAAHRYTLDHNQLRRIEDRFAITHLKDKETGEPLGKHFLEFLAVEWEGILNLPPHSPSKRRFLEYSAGRRTQEQRSVLQANLQNLQQQLRSHPIAWENVLKGYIALIYQYRQSTSLRRRIDSSALTGDRLASSLREFTGYLETLPASSDSPAFKERMEEALDEMERLFNPPPPSSGVRSSR